jgi:hypothetical protein
MVVTIQIKERAALQGAHIGAKQNESLNSQLHKVT